MVVLEEWLDSIILELSPNLDGSVVCYILVLGWKYKMWLRVLEG